MSGLPFIASAGNHNKKIIALMLFSFLITFVIARLFVYLVLGHLLPNFFLNIRGVHVHHFTYGVLLLASLGLYLILKRPQPESADFKWIVLIYGVGLGLTFDEFGMWIRLEDNYWIRQSYDAIIIIVLFFLNLAYFNYLKRGLGELRRLIRTMKIKILR